MAVKDLERGVVVEPLKKAKAEITALRAKNEKFKTKSDSIVDYYNHSEAKTKALCGEVEEAKAMAACAQDEAKSYVLRLALSDLGVDANGAPGENDSAAEFTEWNHQAGGVITVAAGMYGNCYARITASVIQFVLREHRCEHVLEFPHMLNDPLSEDASGVTTELRSFRR
uniref:Uncharacterized protein n=1 Tax=Oryza punctata TaxID=4537 RepID=A0A0E0M5P0_ORYPU